MQLMMSKKPTKSPGHNTLAVRAGQVRTAENENSEAVFLSSSFVFTSAAQAAARFAGDEDGNIYSRFTNPTVRNFEARLAALEGAEQCIATASGMSAIAATFLGLLKSGEHIVSSRSIFGTSVNFFNNILSRFEIASSFVPLIDYAAWERAIRPETRILFLETPSNPLTEIADIQRLAQLAHKHHCLLIVDNCFCTPALQQPFNYGADIVIHSATKYLDGQGRCVGGAVLGAGALLGDAIFGFLRNAGPSMSPFNAWVFLKGLETLTIRLRAHSENAGRIARWLREQDGVTAIHYPGLPEHPQHALAKTQQSGFGGIISFVVRGGKAQAWRLIDNIQLFSITANLGDAKSTITHPATTTHHRLSAAQRTAIGIEDGLIRLSVGLEDPEDLMLDLEQALAAIR